MQLWSLQFLIWTGIAILQSSRIYVYKYIKFGSAVWATSAIVEFSTYWMWAVFTPFIYWLTKKRQFLKKDYRINILIYLAVGVGLSAAHSFSTYTLEFTVKKIAGNLPNSSIFDELASIDRLTIPGIFDSFIIYILILSLLYTYHFYKNLQAQKLRMARTEVDVAKLRLHVLQSQLKPHFLFNALHTVSSLLESDPKKADEVINALSDLLRTSLTSDTKERTTLREELKFIDKYLSIQKIRFQNKLSIYYNIDEKSQDTFVPFMLLQPLVENAVRYGIESGTKQGKVIIKTQCTNGILLITVEDNGPGFKTGIKYLRTGIGISNTSERLNNLYGKGAIFELTNPKKGGARVTIQIPAEYN